MSEKQKIVVVLGSGRCGTSLMMNVAHSLGVEVSENLTRENITNKKGAWEDVDILNISRAILRHFHRSGSYLSYLSMPNGWESDTFTIEQVNELNSILGSRLKNVKQIWGFKEPMTAKLLGIWKKIFNDHSVTPVYLMSLRNPKDVVNSFEVAYGTPRTLSELVWLSRYSDAVINCDVDFEVIDYDDWFSMPIESAQKIIKRVGEIEPLSNSAVRKKIINVIDKGLSTSMKSDITLKSELSMKFYKKLKVYKGGVSEKGSLLSLAHQVREYLDTFNSTAHSVDYIGEQLDKCKTKERELVEKSRQQASELKDYKSSLSKQLDACNSLQSKLAHKDKQLSESRAKQGELAEKSRQQASELKDYKSKLPKQVDACNSLQSKLAHKDKQLSESRAKQGELAEKSRQQASKLKDYKSSFSKELDKCKTKERELVEKSRQQASKLKDYKSSFSKELDKCKTKERELVEKSRQQASELKDYKSRLCKLSDPLKYLENKRSSFDSTKNKIVGGVASFPAREKVFEESLGSLLPQLDHLYVFLNGYKNVPKYLIHDKITVFRSQDYLDLSATGKIFILDKLKECYFFAVDDDILYPKDYVEKMISCIEKYNRKVGVSVHGSIFPENAKWYFERYSLFPFQRELAEDRFVTLIGSGTFAMHTDTLDTKFADFLPNVMVDLEISILAKQQKVPLVCIAREKHWLVALEQGSGLYQKYLEKITYHTTECVNNNPWGFNDYKYFVMSMLDSVFPNLSKSKIRELKLDSEFIKAARSGKIPECWSESALYVKKVLDREAVFDPIGTAAMLRREIRDQRILGRNERNDLKGSLRIHRNAGSRIKATTSYRLGNIIVKAVKYPGKNTVLLPIRMISLIINRKN